MGRITASRKQLKPDPVHHSLLASKFINCLMMDGKKTAAQKVFYAALEIIAEKITDKPSIEVFHQALDNVKPNITSKSAPSASVVLRIKCRCRFRKTGSNPWPFVGFWWRFATKKASQRMKNWPRSSSTPTTKRGRRSPSVKMSTVWPRRTRLLPTLRGSFDRGVCCTV